MKPVIALCDANAFYCSCEQVFDPSLRNRALGVLSNNDGCIISRTSELKALGVAMGTPAFKVRHLLERGEIVLRSSNYPLYGDMSSRFMSVLEQFTPALEVYSIDEAFLDLTGFPDEKLESMGREMKARVDRWTGLPIGVGISTTRTLAKLANYAAKKYRATEGVVDLTSPERQRRLMEITPVGEVWGVGRRIGKRLENKGIHTAAQLVDCQRKWIRREFSLVLERTVCELQGESCIAADDQGSDNKHQIMCSRSFGKRITTLDELHSALACYISRACEKLRAQKQFAREAILFIRTDPFRQNSWPMGGSIRMALPEPSADTRPWLHLLRPALEKLFHEGGEYKKGGFVLLDLCRSQSFQGDLLAIPPHPEAPEKESVMTVLDAINHRFGRNMLRPASVGFEKQDWHMNQQLLSRCYTTRWPDILRINT